MYKRLKFHLERYAKEPVELEEINDTVYIYGSELATLRLLKLYRDNSNARHDYSENRDTYYIAIDRWQ